MILNSLEGQKPDSQYLLYAAADQIYFDLYARPLIKSAAKNCSQIPVHIHVYDPLPAQLQWASQQPNLTVTWEIVDHAGLAKIAKRWSKRKVFANERQSQMYKKSQLVDHCEFQKLINNTYYACVRFVRLAEILPPYTTCLSLDVDGLVRSGFSMDLPEQDIYCYEKPKDGTHLAGALLFQPHVGSRQFLSEYAELIRQAVVNGDLYWFLDQVTLDHLIPQYRKGLLPMSYIDWAMRPNSAIWSAKGRRKDLEIFKRESAKYR